MEHQPKVLYLNDYHKKRNEEAIKAVKLGQMQPCSLAEFKAQVARLKVAAKYY